MVGPEFLVVEVEVLVVVVGLLLGGEDVVMVVVVSRDVLELV